MPADNTAPKVRGGRPFKAGADWTGNAVGRPRGSRNKLGEDFIAALYEDFQVNGADVIQTVRTDKPDQYLKVIASILPKELHVRDVSLDEMSDDELADLLDAVRSIAALDLAAKARKPSRVKAAKEDTGGPGRPH
jgi:hypothetical protein